MDTTATPRLPTRIDQVTMYEEKYYKKVIIHNKTKKLYQPWRSPVLCSSILKLRNPYHLAESPTQSAHNTSACSNTVRVAASCLSGG